MRHRWMIFVPVLGLAVTGMAALEPARADCNSTCSGLYTSSAYPNDYTSRLSACMLNCSLNRSKPKTAYGALAYGANSTAYGFSYRQGQCGAAAQVALDECKPNGDDCKVVYDFSNTCAALAAVESKGVFAAAYAPSKAPSRASGDGRVRAPAW